MKQKYLKLRKKVFIIISLIVMFEPLGMSCRSYYRKKIPQKNTAQSIKMNYIRTPFFSGFCMLFFKKLKGCVFYMRFFFSFFLNK